MGSHAPKTRTARCAAQQPERRINERGSSRDYRPRPRARCRSDIHRHIHNPIFPTQHMATEVRRCERGRQIRRITSGHRCSAGGRGISTTRIGRTEGFVSEDPGLCRRTLRCERRHGEIAGGVGKSVRWQRREHVGARGEGGFKEDIARWRW